MKNKFKKVLLSLTVALTAVFAVMVSRNSVFGAVNLPVDSRSSALEADNLPINSIAQKIFENFYAQDLTTSQIILRNTSGEQTRDIGNSMSIHGEDAAGNVVDWKDVRAANVILDVYVDFLPNELKNAMNVQPGLRDELDVGLRAFEGHEQGDLKAKYVLPNGKVLSEVCGEKLSIPPREFPGERSDITKWHSLGHVSVSFKIPITAIFNKIVKSIDGITCGHQLGMLEFYDGDELLGVVTNLDRILEERKFGPREIREAYATGEMSNEKVMANSGMNSMVNSITNKNENNAAVVHNSGSM